MSDWVLLPPWSIRTIAIAGIVMLALAVFRSIRERPNVPLRRQIPTLAARLVALAILAWIALNPTFMTPQEVEGKPSLVVLVDTSYSMSTADVDPGDGTGGKPRIAAALAVLTDEKTREALEKHFDLDVRRFDRDTTASRLVGMKPEDAEGTASDVSSALTSAAADQGNRKVQAGVLLVSDGRATTGGALDAARLALARSVPVWTWCLGGEVPRRDLWIEATSGEVLAFAGADVELSATLGEQGYPDRTFAVEVTRDGKVVETVEAKPASRPDGTRGPGGRPVKVTVKAPEAGEARYVFRVIEERDEAEKQNNERSVFVRAVGEKVRVLVVEGQPHWDTKFLVQCLKRSPRVDVTAVYRLGKDRQFAVISAGGTDRREETDLFPRSAEAFSAYDVVIMGRGCEAFFDAQTEEYLTEFVARHGGGLIFSRGKAYGGRFGALAKLEPVVWGEGADSAVKLVPRGAAGAGPVFELAKTGDLDALIDRLPLFDRAMHTVGIKPLAVTLADGEAVPIGREEKPVVLAYHLYGQGRVVTLNASGLWRWSFREKGEDRDEFVYDRFWLGLLRWLLSGSDFLAGHDVALRSDRRLYTDEQPMQFLIRTRGLDEEAYRPRLLITPSTGSGPSAVDGETQVEPRRSAGGTYLAEAGPFAPGSYTVKLVNNLGNPKELTTTVDVVSGAIENRNLSADRDLMRELARITEGRTLDADDVASLGGIFAEWRARRELAERKSSMWDRWWLLALMVVVLGTEWLVRRREGLL